VLRHELKNIHVTITSDYAPDLAEALARRRLNLAFLRSDHRLTASAIVRPQDSGLPISALRQRRARTVGQSLARSRCLGDRWSSD